MQSTLIGTLLALTCLLVACNKQPQTHQNNGSSSVAAGRYVARAGEVGELLRRIDAATRNVQNARYLASISQDGTPPRTTFVVTVKRDPIIPGPYYGRILLVITNKPTAIAFDGKSFRAQPFDPEKPMTEDAARLVFSIFADTWIHFLHPTPFQHEIDAPIARLEGERDIAGRLCSVVYVEYKNGQRARWFFDQRDGLPRRVERLSIRDGKESAQVVTITHLQVNGTVGEATFNIRRRAARFSKAAARHLARIYVLTNPLAEGDFRAYLSQNRPYFVENGQAVQLAKELGLALRTAGVSSYDPGAEERAHRIASQTGVSPEFAPEVARNLNRNSLDLWRMGNELLWLAEVLPPATRGDFGPYETTGTWQRQQIRQVLPILKTLLTSDPEMAQMYNAVLKEYRPFAEEYIMSLFKAYSAMRQ